MEIKLDKPDDRSWGFRLTGGADCEEPLTVVKVSEGSLAELAGLKVDDVIVKVNDISTSDLTHMQVHNVIQESGRTLLLVVERRQDLIEKETTNTGTKSQETERNEETFANNTEKQLKIGPVETESTPEVQLQNSIQDSPSPAPDIAMHERKWSTFLQKPKREKPKPKKTDNVEIKGEPYRVVIKKQKKKNQQTSLNASTEEPRNDEETVEETDTTIKSDVDINSENNIDSVNEGENTELTEVDKEEISAEVEENVQQQVQDEEKPEQEVSKSEAAIAVETTQKALTLEEQLAQVQKQLQELAQLPSTIQSTLDAVTKKLASIVNAAQQEQQQEQEHNEQERTATENDISEEISLKEAIINDEERDEKEDIEQQEEMVDFEVYLPETEPKKEERNEEPTLGQIIEENEVPEQEMPTEEELEQERIQREKFEKIQKELKSGRSLEQKPDFPLTPLERPIILPGGRRWSQPDDACPAIRNPKMTDEKIADTIETYSEVIAGQIKGLTIGTIFGHGPTKKREFTESIF